MKKLWTSVLVALFAAGLAAGAAPTAAGAAEPELPDAVRESIEHRQQQQTPAAASASGDEVSAASFGRIDDPVGDSQPISNCFGDISRFDVVYQASYLEVRTTPVCATDPHSHPSWVVGISTAAWYIDATLDGFDDFVIVVFHDGSHLVGGLYDLRYADPLFLCSAAVSVNSGSEVRALVGAGCLGAPQNIQLQAEWLFDENPYGATCTCPIDYAPNGVYTPIFNLTDPAAVFFTGDGPGVASLNQGGAMMVFARGQDDGLYARRFNGSTWENWIGLGGIVTGTPSAVSAQPGQLDVFVRGADNALWTQHYNGSTFSGWSSLGGILSTPPAVVSSDPGVIDVFLAGFNSRMYTRRFASGSWSNWSDLGGIITAMPAAASPGPGLIEVFARGQDAGLWTQRFNGSWSGWITLGGIITSAPGAAAPGGGPVQVFARGNDAALWTRTSDPSSGWETLGGILVSPAAVTSASPGEVDVFVRGSNAALYTIHREGPTWGNWETLGGIIK